MSTYYNIYAVNGRTGKIIARTGAPDKDTAILIASGLSIGAKAFQKSAFTAVYEAGGRLIHTCNYLNGYMPLSGTEAGLLKNRENHSAGRTTGAANRTN